MQPYKHVYLHSHHHHPEDLDQVLLLKQSFQSYEDQDNVPAEFEYLVVKFATRQF